MPKTPPLSVPRGLAALVVASTVCASAFSQAPADTFNYTQTTSYTYYSSAQGAAKGLVATVTVEPNNAASCVRTTYTYDLYLNRDTAATANCAGATGFAAFTSRSISSAYGAAAAQAILVNGISTSVAVPAGAFATTETNALGQAATKEIDPRFGAVTKLVDVPNALAITRQVDDFGRKVKETQPDSTSTVYFYCYLPGGGRDVSSNSGSCPTPLTSETPVEAAMFTHEERRDSVGSKMGPFTRVYSDRLGRVLRTVTEGFDGATQPMAVRAGLVVTDTVYNAFGAKVIETQPYFLVAGGKGNNSSTVGGTANDFGVTRTDYDVLGRPTSIYRADSSGSQSSVTFGSYGSRRAALYSFSYDALRTAQTNDKTQTRVEDRNGYGELVRITDFTGAQLAHQRDAFGNLVATKDALQNTISITYDIRGRKLSISDPDAGVVGYCYDALGQLKAQQTSNMRGSNAVGACPTAASAGTIAAVVAGWTTFAYDVLGRTTQRVEPEYTSTWSYDQYANTSACNKGVGQLCETTTSHGINRKLVYDNFGRPINSRTTVTAGPSFASVVSYDTNTGRLTGQRYPSGLAVSYGYTAVLGYLEALKLASTNSVSITPLPSTPGGAAGAASSLAAGALLWQAQTVNAWGLSELEVFGNAIQRRATFEASTGRTQALSAGAGAATNVLNHTYGWDSLSNLTSRIDANGDGNSGAVSETFTYGDRLNRLTAYAVSAPAIPGLMRNVTLQYNALGMLLFKSDVGVYSYGAQGAGQARPHALQSVKDAGGAVTGYAYDANGNRVTASAGKFRTLAYTSFNLPDSQLGIGGPNGSLRYTWLYDEDHQRIKEQRVDSSGTRTTWNVHPDNVGGLNFEREEAPGGNSNRHYLSVGGRAVGVLVSTGPLPNLAPTATAPPAISTLALVKAEYWHKDHLGSLSATTDHAGALTARYAYDPFGKRRYTNGSYDAFGNIVVDWDRALNAGTDRGYTGHEHLDDIGLVHMNGRVFDPTTGAFLQADPHITDPSDLQNYNRYGYCLNNPLSCTDPSGFDPADQTFVIIGNRLGFGYDPNTYGYFGATTSGYAPAPFYVYQSPFANLPPLYTPPTPNPPPAYTPPAPVNFFPSFDIYGAPLNPFTGQPYFPYAFVPPPSAAPSAAPPAVPAPANAISPPTPALQSVAARVTSSIVGFGASVGRGIDNWWSTSMAAIQSEGPADGVLRILQAIGPGYAVFGGLAKLGRTTVLANEVGIAAKGIAAEGKTVLGHFPEYKQLGESLSARTFNVPEAAWNKMSEAERWGANQKFLDRMISRGDQVILSTPLDKVRPGSYFARELEYMGSKGYVPSADGTRLIKP